MKTWAPMVGAQGAVQILADLDDIIVSAFFAEMSWLWFPTVAERARIAALDGGTFFEQFMAIGETHSLTFMLDMPFSISTPYNVIVPPFGLLTFDLVPAPSFDYAHMTLDGAGHPIVLESFHFTLGEPALTLPLPSPAEPGVGWFQARALACGSISSERGHGMRVYTSGEAEPNIPITMKIALGAGDLTTNLFSSPGASGVFVHPRPVVG